MKKIFLIVIAALAFGCESGNESSDRGGSGSEIEERTPMDPDESDHAIHSDSTTSAGMNRPSPYDTL